MMTDGKIIQIIPADGWYSCCKLDDGTLWNTPLACWALIENQDGTREVRGLEAHDYVDDAEGDGGFQNYVHKSNLPE